MVKRPGPDMRARLAKTRRILRRSGAGALLVSSEAGIRYLSGFYCHGALILLPAVPRAAYLVDPMNYPLARKALSGSGFYVKSAPGDKLKALTALARDLGIRRMGVEEDALSLASYKKLSRALKGIKLLPAGAVLKEARVVKTPGELKIIRQAAGETVRIWRAVLSRIRTGMTERQIACLIDVEVRRRGYENSFPTIVATGPNSAYPHAIPTDRRLMRGKHLLVDFGIRVEGYCSDLTRVWGNGRIMRKIGLFQRHAHLVQKRIINKIKAGVAVRTLVDEASLYYKKNGLASYVCHGLGHGVGLEIHEAPSLGVSGSNDKLKAGMVVTVEPGFYLPGTGGVRVEDMVLVTERGCEVLTR